MREIRYQRDTEKIEGTRQEPRGTAVVEGESSHTEREIQTLICRQPSATVCCAAACSNDDV